MLADQTKVSPWINADPSVGFSLKQEKRVGPGAEAAKRNVIVSDCSRRKTLAVLVGDDKVTRCGAPSLHKTQKTSVGLEELQQLFLYKRPLYIH